MKIFTFIILGLLSIPVESKDCEAIGNYARLVMIMRNFDTVVPSQNLPPSFPAETLREEVMHFSIIDPKLAYLKFKVECMDVGYLNMRRRLREMKLERMMDQRK